MLLLPLLERQGLVFQKATAAVEGGEVAVATSSPLEVVGACNNSLPLLPPSTWSKSKVKESRV